MVVWKLHDEFIGRHKILDYHRRRNLLQEELSIRAVPSSVGHRNFTFLSQKSDFSVLSFLISLSRVDLPDNFFFVPISKPASRFFQYCFQPDSTDTNGEGLLLDQSR
jgi:hypothetical protein